MMSTINDEYNYGRGEKGSMKEACLTPKAKKRFTESSHGICKTLLNASMYSPADEYITLNPSTRKEKRAYRKEKPQPSTFGDRPIHIAAYLPKVEHLTLWFIQWQQSELPTELIID